MKVFYEIPDEIGYTGPIEVDCRKHDLDAMAKACAAHYHKECNERWGEWKAKSFTLFDGKQKLAEGIEVWIDGEPVYATNE